MPKWYEDTCLTPLRVAQTQGYIDWASQPHLFKHYPKFLFNYGYGDNSSLRLIELCRIITSKRDVGGRPYYQLNTPSAGNLHPLELYVQVRGIKGILSGIYHVNPEVSCITLIQEIEHDGLESYVGLTHKFQGILLLLSNVPYRSEWKYNKRALRYCYMDAGHQIGAIETAFGLQEQKVTFLSDFDAKVLHKQMGFTNEEYISAVMGVGDLSEKPVIPMKRPLMQVSPSNYTESSGYIELYLNEDTPYYPQSLPQVRVDESHLLSRRSARQFSNKAMSHQTFKTIMELIPCHVQSFSSYLVVMGDASREGLYYKNERCEKGDFSKTITALLVDQKFITKSDIVIIMSAPVSSKDNIIDAARWGHHIGMQAQKYGLGYSAIGAFYDKKLASFLKINEEILYVGVLGTPVQGD